MLSLAAYLFQRILTSSHPYILTQPEESVKARASPTRK